MKLMPGDLVVIKKELGVAVNIYDRKPHPLMSESMVKTTIYHDECAIVLWTNADSSSIELLSQRGIKGFAVGGLFRRIQQHDSGTR